MPRTSILVAAALVAAVAVDLAVGVNPPGATALVALASCLGLAIGAKWLGVRFVQRPAPSAGPTATIDFADRPPAAARSAAATRRDHPSTDGDASEAARV